MLRLTIEEKDYKAPEGWDDLTLRKFIELCDIEIPEKLRNLWLASASENDEDYKKADEVIGVEETYKIFPKYYGEVLGCLTDIPYEVLDRIDGVLRGEFFNKYLRHFIYSSFARYPVHIVDGKLEMYDPEYKEKFELNGVEYFLPENLLIYNEDIPLGKEQAVSFTEASDIEVALRNMAEGAANRIPMFVAIYCRPKGEEYNERDTINRAKIFYDLPMEEVWRVFFCTYRQLGKYQNSTQKYSKRVAEVMQEKLSSLD